MADPADRSALSRRAFLRLGAATGLATLALPLGLRVALAEAAAKAPAGSTAARIIFHGDRSKRTLALTIDDGWSPERVRVILGELQKAGIVATFMPYARAMQADRRLWKTIAAAGFPIGNHTTTHPMLTGLSAKRQLSEITDARSIAEDMIGRPTIPVFRPPYGAYNQSVVDAAVHAGFPNVLLWDTSDRDTSPTGTAAHMIQAAEQGTNGSILMAHGGPVVTPTILPTIIAHYLANGFTFVTVPQLIGLAPGAVAGPTPSSKPPAAGTGSKPTARPSKAPNQAPAGSGITAGGAGAGEPGNAVGAAGSGTGADPAVSAAGSGDAVPAASTSATDVAPVVVVGAAASVGALAFVARRRSRPGR